MITATKGEVANYLVNRSFLHEKGESVNEVLETLSCIQVDPINVVARNHELSLWNRVENFKKGDLYNELYTKRSLFEYWLQLYSIIPVKFYPYFALRRGRSVGWQTDFEAAHKKEIKAVLDFVSINGPTSARDLAHLPKTKSYMSWFAGNSHAAALNYLWDRGEVAVHHRDKNLKVYDLTERVIPKKYFNKRVTLKMANKFFLESQFAYNGIIKTPSLARGRIGYIKNSPIHELFLKRKVSGEILEIDIKNVKAKYSILKKDYPKFRNISKSSMHTGVSILPPLDPLVIDRKLLRDVFDFSYTWEAYVPVMKRKFGYYGMPILYNGGFVGQIDLKKNKRGKLDKINIETKIKSKELSHKLKEKIGELEGFIKTQ